MGPEYIPKIEIVASLLTDEVSYWYIVTSNVSS